MTGGATDSGPDGDALNLHARLCELEEHAGPETWQTIHAKLDELLADQALTPTNIHWPDLEPEKAAVLWSALLDWLSQVLLARYGKARRALQGCWWRHPDAVDAVTAAWVTWCAAYRSGAAKAADAGTWQGTWLPAMIGQVEEALASCEQGHDGDTWRSDAMATVPPIFDNVGTA